MYFWKTKNLFENILGAQPQPVGLKKLLQVCLKSQIAAIIKKISEFFELVTFTIKIPIFSNKIFRLIGRVAGILSEMVEGGLISKTSRNLAIWEVWLQQRRATATGLEDVCI